MSEDSTLKRLKEEAEVVIDKLKHERDELHLQSHLFKAEMKDEWDEVESKWHDLEKRFEHLVEDSRDSAEDIGSAIKKVGDEIAQAYRRLRGS